MTDPNAAIGDGWVRLGRSIDRQATKAEIPLDGLMLERTDVPGRRGVRRLPSPGRLRHALPIPEPRAARRSTPRVAEYRQVGRADP